MMQHNSGHMKALLTFSGPMVAVCIFFIYWYLVQIEINKTLSLPTGLESVGSHEDFAKEKKKQASSSPTNNNNNNNKDGLEDEPVDDNTHGPSMMEVVEMEERPRRYRITQLRNIILFSVACALSLLTYLLLVVSKASLWLSLCGVACVLGLGLWQQITEELRRQRLDRIVAIITIIFLAASFMSLATYASQSLAEGEVYEGKARIIGFDYESYDNSGGDVTRTDLEVAWGGEWGCPMVDDGKQCTAFVQGAMCETEKKNDDEEEVEEDEDGGRFLNDNNNNEDEEAEENEELEEDVEEEEEANEDLEEENYEDEEENEELEEEVEEEEEEVEEYTEDLEEEVIDLSEDYTYYYDDDMMTDSYWDEQEWGNVWGDYACYDLFDYDMSGSTYDADEAPGDDDWPFVNVYGNCKSCDAYIVDYYSTEHYNDIQNYRIQGRNYLLFSLVGVALTAFLHLKHKMDPIKEGELELITNDGGALA